MAKGTGKSLKVFNLPLEEFLIALAVDTNGVRKRFAGADETERVVLLATEFKLGPQTIKALIQDRGDGQKVRSKLRISDQQASSTPPPPKSFRRKKSSKKR